MKSENVCTTTQAIVNMWRGVADISILQKIAKNIIAESNKM